MATFLDTLSILSYFSGIFAALLVFTVIYALLSVTKILGENKVVQTLVAILLAILTLIYPDLISLVNFVAPWYVMLFLFLVLLLMTYRIFGVTEKNVADYVTGDRTINWVILAVGLIILIAGIFTVFGQRALEATTQNQTGGAGFQAGLFTTLFNPQILGMLMVFAIGVFAIAFLGGGGMVSGASGGGGGGHGGGH